MSQLHMICTLAVVGGLSKIGGGTSYTVPSWSNALAENGVKRTLVSTLPTGEEQSDHLDERQVEWVKVPRWKNIPWAPSLGRVLDEICRTKQIQLVHNHGAWLPANHSSVETAKKFNIPLVTTPHGMLTHWSLHHRVLKKRMAWWAFQKKDLFQCAAIHVTAKREAEDLRTLGFKGVIALIPNGVELPEWKPLDKPKGEIRTALFLSRIHPKKGLLDLVGAWSKVRPQGWKIKIVGPNEGGHLAEVKKAVKEEDLENFFEFSGPVYGGEKDILYRKSDLFILPTHDENFGMVVAEALSFGVPVLTTQGAPWGELSTYGCGWWVPVGTSALAPALSEATRMTDEERGQMGRRGRKLVEDHYTWGRAAQKMKALYEWLLGGKETPNFLI